MRMKRKISKRNKSDEKEKNVSASFMKGSLLTALMIIYGYQSLFFQDGLAFPRKDKIYKSRNIFIPVTHCQIQEGSYNPVFLQLNVFNRRRYGVNGHNLHPVVHNAH